MYSISVRTEASRFLAAIVLIFAALAIPVAAGAASNNTDAFTVQIAGGDLWGG
jgi:hypothetical protein